MIVLDTNVLSELMRQQPDSKVLAWLDGQKKDDVLLTAITVAEVMVGVALLPDGQRKARLQQVADRVFTEGFAGQILPFDDVAARHYAELVALRSRSGRPIGMADVQIAAICRSYNASLATRNAKDFEGGGLTLINPWQV